MKKENNTPFISVVIPSYNEEERIVRCLRSVFAQQLEETFEVIVVDSSIDSTPQIIAEQFPQVRLVHRDPQTLPGLARNIGVQQARGKIIAFLDGHCVADTSWLRTALLPSGSNAPQLAAERPQQAVGSLGHELFY